MTDERGELAHWLRALDQLQPQSDSEFDAIARLLGLRLKTAEKKTTAIPERQKSKPEATPEVVAPSPDPTTWANKPRRRLESVLTPGNSTRNPAPRWLATARYMETTEPSHLRPVMPLDPLFPARTSRAILSGALATPSANGPLDVARMIVMLSRAEVFEEIPRLSIPTLVRGVQLLIDRGKSMEPFAADQAALRSALARVVGRDRTEVLYFDGSPLWGAGTGAKDEWPEYQPPAPGTPVVVLTDLGIAQPPGVGGLPGASDWYSFADVLVRAGCPLLALVPYPKPRWPPVSKRITVLQWDRATTAAAVRRAVPGGLRIVNHV